MRLNLKLEFDVKFMLLSARSFEGTNAFRLPGACASYSFIKGSRGVYHKCANLIYFFASIVS